MNKKMADVDIDPFEEHESRPEEPTDEHIPLDPVTPGGRSTWDSRGAQALQALWNQHMNRKHLLEVQVVQVYFTRNT